MEENDAKVVAHKLEGKERTADVRLKEVAPFNKMLLSNAIRKGLQQAGFIYPTIIQATAIPVGKSGLDLLVQSKSGTGKTLIFSTILLEAYRNNVVMPQALVIAPTREIAIQIETVLNQIGRCIPGFRAVAVIGGLDVAEDRKRLVGAKAVVGTPGRLVHVIQSEILNTTEMRLVVLDEADKLHNPPFRADVTQIQNALPAQRQTIACSATFCNGLDQVLAKVMRNPLLISTEDRATLLVGIKQFVYELPEQKTSILEMQAKLDGVRRIFGLIPFKQCVIFASTQSRADSYRNHLEKDGWPCDLITGALDQKTRLETFHKFREFKTRIILATDLMSRGVDSEHVNLVINLELASDVVTYLHRIGRAGRFGSHGLAISFVSSEKDRRTMRKLGAEVGAGMSLLRFPAKEELADDEECDFWDFDAGDKGRFEVFGDGDVATTLRAPLATTDELSTVASAGTPAPVVFSAVKKALLDDSNSYEFSSSIETRPFQVDLQDSAVNLPGKSQPVVDAGNLDAQALPANDNDCECGGDAQLLTFESQHSSTQQLPTLSSNTIDDASSIAADSLRSNSHQADEAHHKSPALLPQKPALLECLVDGRDSPASGRRTKAQPPIDVFADYERTVRLGGGDSPEAEDLADAGVANVKNTSNVANTVAPPDKLAQWRALVIDQPTPVAAKTADRNNHLYSDYANYNPNASEATADDQDDDDSTSLSQTTATADVDTATFMLSVATPSNVHASLEELQNCSSLLVDGVSSQHSMAATTTTATSTGSHEVKHFPSLVEQPVPTALSKLTLNAPEQFEIPPDPAGRHGSGASSTLSANDGASVTSNSGDEKDTLDSAASSAAGEDEVDPDGEGGNASSGFNEKSTTSASSGIETSDSEVSGGTSSDEETDVDTLNSGNYDCTYDTEATAYETTATSEEEDDEDDDDDDDENDDLLPVSEQLRAMRLTSGGSSTQSTASAYQRAYQRWMDTYWQQLTHVQNYVQLVAKVHKRPALE